MGQQAEGIWENVFSPLKNEPIISRTNTGTERCPGAKSCMVVCWKRSLKSESRYKNTAGSRTCPVFFRRVC